MNKPFYILLFVFFVITIVTNSSHAQTNLVINGDFELYDTCPSSYSTPGDLQIEHAINWKTPTMGTSDYYNTCATLWVVGVPNNAFGYQIAYSGVGYAGFFVYLNNDNYREYIQAKLTQPMIADNNYEIGFYINLSGYSGYASSQIGVYLSSFPIGNVNNGNALNVIPQIENPIGNIITDTTNWTLIRGIYTASGGEEYITIGNFNDSLNNDTLKLSAFDNTSYYYIDGIFVNAMGSEMLLPNVLTPNGDRINDTFNFSNLGFPVLSVIIYNRWGIKIFETTKPNSAWDGYTTSGIPCSDGVYFYVVETRISDNQTKNEKGFIQLIR